MRAHGTVVAGDDDPAAAGGLVGTDEVLGVDAGFFVLGAQRRGVLVGADTADVEGGVWWEDVLPGTVERGQCHCFAGTCICETGM